MAQKIENKKGFKVLKMGLDEINNIGGLTICDFCGTPSLEGYYVAVLNQWLCQKCYNEWYLRAKHYPEDIAIENKNYTNMQNMLEL